MKFKNLVFSALLLSSFLIFSSHSVLQAQTQVQRDVHVIETHGKVEFLRANDTVWRLALEGTLLKTGDSIRAGKEADAILQVDSLGVVSMVRIISDTEVKMSDLALDQNTAKENTLLDLAIGDVLVFTKPQQGSQFQVKTPTAIAGARGTDFQVEYSQGRTDVACYGGENGVEVTSVGVGGGQKNVKEGTEVVGIESSQPIPDPKPLSSAKWEVGKRFSMSLKLYYSSTIYYDPTGKAGYKRTPDVPLKTPQTLDYLQRKMANDGLEFGQPLKLDAGLDYQYKNNGSEIDSMGGSRNLAVGRFGTTVLFSEGNVPFPATLADLINGSFNPPGNRQTVVNQGLEPGRKAY